MATNSNDKTVVFVSGFDEQVDEKVLAAAFLPFGDIVDVHIPPSKTTDDTHRGFGFVEFEDAEDAKAAVDNMHFSELFGQVIKVNSAKPLRRLEAGISRAVWTDDAWLQKYASMESTSNPPAEEDVAKNDEVSETEAKTE
ncbi:hypothetical protein IWQ62_002776 [Dispira parvispora]|uniref:RRM domain-containing protein n=1 Tax=Dispira parvispora TaxID=1520584 RepID=A0A9W8E2C0_9FUNG|nr:hypothetical protein IWQ62_002776 [Dispira parvispora]